MISNILILIVIAILLFLLARRVYTDGFNNGYDGYNEGLSNISLNLKFKFTEEELDYIISKLNKKEDIDINVKDKELE